MFKNTAYRQPEGRRADVPRRDRRAGAVPDRRDAGSEDAVVAARGGINWDVGRATQRTQVRGGTGLFTGPPLYVWISNQLGNTGVLIGEILRRQHRRRVSVQPESGPLQAGERDRRGRRQLRAERHRSGLQVPAGLAHQHRRRSAAAAAASPAPREFLYNKDVNGIYYINANLPAAQTTFTGVDTRPRWTANRHQQHVCRTSSRARSC